MSGERDGTRPATGHARVAPVAGIALLSFTVLLVVVGAVLLFGRGDFGRIVWGLPGVQVLWALGFSAAGYPITRRHPANPVGWLLVVAGVAAGVNLVGVGIWAGTTVGAAATPDGGGPASMLESAWVFSVAALSSAVVLFPSGSPPSRWWRAQLGVLWGSSVLTYLYAASTGFAGLPEWPNLIATAVTNVFVFFLAAGFFALLVRWRRSGPLERQQLKWVAYGVVLIGITAPVVEIGVANLAPDWYLSGTVVSSIVILAVPVTMGVAMLRYRLYDIDVVINRTLVYGSLTATLALIYLGAVVALQYGFRTLTGEGSQLAIVASTLAIAALFNPLRRRVQTLVDRRFYRQKYDAARTLEAFSAKLRDETELELLNAELLSVVQETMQPERLTLWLREPAADKRLEVDDR